LGCNGWVCSDTARKREPSFPGNPPLRWQLVSKLVYLDQKLNIDTTLPDTAPTKHGCHSCGQSELRLASSYGQLHRVTSDCKPWPPGGQIGFCPNCGLTQMVTDAAWQESSRAIYSQYEVYHQSGGIEQTVFQATTGRGRSRSQAIVEGFLQTAKVPAKGRMLDVGCANGNFLQAFGPALPGWQLNGSEFDTRHQARVEALPGVDRFYTGQLETIPGTFDAISFIHVLEHIAAPTRLLQTVREKLNPGGWLLIEVPDCLINPFMLLVADHASHFCPATLTAVVANAGFEVLRADDAWVAKEISLLARRTDGPAPASHHWPVPPPAAAQTFANWEVLDRIAAEAAQLRSAPSFGIFGSSIAATWLDAQTGRTCSFFVDEDPNRPGRQHQSRPILSVADIPANAAVYLALPRPMAHAVANRLRPIRPDVRFVTP